MKNATLILLILLLFNCKSDDGTPQGDIDLIGEWKLIEQLADPGDGSGTFLPIESDKVITFFNDGTVTSNGLLCSMSSEAGTEDTGIYEAIETSFSYGEITPDNCVSNFFNVVYYKIEGANLILWYQCIESCGFKFEKI
ncbi:hypothetical protein Q4Q35_08825 [Flavivirga aquimarina]|uniref:Lipocalin-like domain-containing protein n=1 Tax=Flavivirga aquimarina TaxID=2027862 RepID=A0ABT8WA19_9FLAO|nr:hypothetical protein [Flavivirga aquimarina]MDO5969911.1 hypothetical protein [Flavivirga aquimarina]